MSRPFLALLDRVDPRSRLLVAIGFSVLVAIANEPAALVSALVAAACGALLSGMGPKAIAKRLVPLNVFMLLLIVVMPLTVPGQSIAVWGPFRPSQEGLELALTIALKGNAIVLMLVGLIGALHMNSLGHALGHLHVPDKLAHLFLFTVRYLEVLRHEYVRLSTAMRLRGFRARPGWHTYRTYGHLIGMLLVRSLDRSERILAAMKCRGFRGQFYLLDHFHFSRSDAVFSLLSIIVLALVGVLEWR